MKRIDLIRHIEAGGCTFLREGGRHTVYINPTARKVSTIPRHREINEFMAAGGVSRGGTAHRASWPGDHVGPVQRGADEERTAGPSRGRMIAARRALPLGLGWSLSARRHSGSIVPSGLQ